MVAHLTNWGWLIDPQNLIGYHPPPVHCARVPAQNGPKGPIIGGGALEVGGGPFYQGKMSQIFPRSNFPIDPGPNV